jgi:hypothetical protein
MSATGTPTGVLNPGSVSFIAGTGAQLQYQNLTRDELTVFDRDLIKLADYFSLSRDLNHIFLEDRDAFLWAASIAKQQLQVGFGGAVPGSGQFGMQLIRAKTILSTSTFLATDWLQSWTSPGWQTAPGIFGSVTSPVDMSTTNTNPGNPQNRVLLCITKLYCTTIPKLREVWFHIGATDYPIWPIEFRGMGDLYVAGLPATPLITKNGKFFMNGNLGSISGTIDGTAPLGLTFALAEYMVSAGQQ